MADHDYAFSFFLVWVLSWWSVIKCEVWFLSLQCSLVVPSAKGQCSGQTPWMLTVRTSSSDIWVWQSVFPLSRHRCAYKQQHVLVGLLWFLGNLARYSVHADDTHLGLWVIICKNVWNTGISPWKPSLVCKLKECPYKPRASPEFSFPHLGAAGVRFFWVQLKQSLLFENARSNTRFHLFETVHFASNYWHVKQMGWLTMWWNDSFQHNRHCHRDGN